MVQRGRARAIAVRDRSFMEAFLQLLVEELGHRSAGLVVGRPHRPDDVCEARDLEAAREVDDLVHQVPGFVFGRGARGQVGESSPSEVDARDVRHGELVGNWHT